ncbi:MAG TPA: hypothetical protein VLJ21_01700 [Candidatus Binatia bacterium]|nr:hypothetical protein [Candidatus Binatia bacterium]
MKVAYIIPGFTDSARARHYHYVCDSFLAKGITPSPIKIDWSKWTLTEYVQQFFEQYRPEKRQETYLLGFSWGAMIALVASREVRPKQQILCSLSPYFKEDLPRIPRKQDDARSLEDFARYSFAEIARTVPKKPLLVVGGEEARDCIRRSLDAAKKLSGTLFVAGNAFHDISDPAYRVLLKEVIANL